MYIIYEEAYDLYGKFRYFNKEFFDNALPDTKLSFENLGKHTMGSFTLATHTIKISTNAKAKSEIFIDHILIHEMIHYYTLLFKLNVGNQAHGRAFKAKVAEINKKSNNKYRLTVTDVSMTLDSDTEKEEKTLYAVIPHYEAGVSASSVSATIQYFTEENFNSRYMNDLAQLYKNFGDAKHLSLVKTTMNNNFISEDWLGTALNTMRKPSWTTTGDKYFIKMMKQSKDYKIIGYYNGQNWVKR
jgi:predicted SprT family Zn-dependent metalloprotease